jgi:hypothetical protein
MANIDLYPVKSTRREIVTVAGSFVGGTTAATKATGYDVTVTYVSTGLYTLTFADVYAENLAFITQLQAATPGDVKGHGVVADTMSAGVIQVSVYDASNNLHDLAASEWLHFVAVFRNTDTQ